MWFLVWSWFFKSGKSFGRKVRKALAKAIELGNYKKAKELLLRLPGLNNDTENKCKLGIVHLKLDEDEEAKKCFEEVLNKNPKHFDALINLAQVLQFQEKYDEAIGVYEKALKEKPKDINILLNMGEILYKQDEFKKAIEILEKAKELAPENIQILFAILKCKSELCDLENNDECQEIINGFKNLSEKENLPVDFHISLAKIYAKTGQIDEAFQACQKAIEANEENIEAYKLLGLIQLLKKEFSDAKNSLSVALNFQDNNKEVHNIFSYLFCSHEDGCELQKCRQKYYELIKKHQLNK